MRPISEVTRPRLPERLAPRFSNRSPTGSRDPMTSQAIRDPLADHLITPQNAALVLIDYQPSQFGTVRSIDPGLLRKNIVSTVKAAPAFELPIGHSPLNVASPRRRGRSSGRSAVR